MNRAALIRGGQRALPLSGLLGGIALAHALRAALGPLDPLLAQWPRLCPLFALTGIRCPTCGLGRALIDTAAGDVAQAFHHHPLGPLLMGGAVIASLLLATRAGLLKRALVDAGRACKRHPRLMTVLVALYILWGVAREMCTS